MLRALKETLLGVLYITIQAPFFLTGAISAVFIIPARSGFNYSRNGIKNFADNYVQRNEKFLKEMEAEHE